MASITLLINNLLGLTAVEALKMIINEGEYLYYINW